MAEQPKRPKSVTGLLVLVLMLAGLGWLRFASSTAQWSLLQDLNLVGSPSYILGSGLIGGVTGTVLVGGLWLGKDWAPQATRIGALAFTAYFWLDKLFVQSSPLAMNNWPFAAAVSAALLGFTLWTLGRPAARAYFGDSDE